MYNFYKCFCRVNYEKASTHDTLLIRLKLLTSTGEKSKCATLSKNKINFSSTRENGKKLSFDF